MDRQAPRVYFIFCLGKQSAKFESKAAFVHFTNAPVVE